MKTVVLMAMVLAAPQFAHADGLRCETHDGALRVTVYDHTSANDGTRNAAVMVFSDPSVQAGRKTIATFNDVKGTLSNTGATYVANVDLRVSGSSRGGEYLAGTRLMYVDQIVMDVSFLYGDDLPNGEAVEGTLVVIKRDGNRIEKQISCDRYLKN